MEMIQEERTRQEIEKLLEEKQYTRLRQLAAELNDADIAAAMEEMDGYSQQFSFCRTYQSPERLKKMLRDFLNGPAFSTISEA